MSSPISYPDEFYAVTNEAPVIQDQMPLDVPEPVRREPKVIPAEPSEEGMDPSVVMLPDADLPLYSPNAPEPIATASKLLEMCALYMSEADLEGVRAAYKLADEAHLGQFRKSGEPYITHPIAVAMILASWKLDTQTIQAGLMHDVLEDCGISKHEMAERFGMDVAELVDGVSKLDKLHFTSKEAQQAESFQKMFLAMARDVRVILIKLADRLHNLRTLGVMRYEKRARIAKETLDVYVPMAHRLGLNSVFRELQELSFANRYPFRYEVLYANVMKMRDARRQALESILRRTQTELPHHGIRPRIIGRDKTIYGIYNKMRYSHQSFSDALDIYGFRIIVRTREECYLTLGALHAMYKPVHRRFKDFIAIPKLNGYQGIHTTVIDQDGNTVEFQIRTEAMHRIAEYGLLSQWMFKNTIDAKDIQSRVSAWLENLMEIQKTSANSSEFYENFKVDLFPNRLYAFTPNGRIVSLPKGSCAIDFAYQIHSDIGTHAKEVKINGETFPITQRINNGDQVEIITSPDSTPSPEWLEYIRSGRARAEVQKFLRSQQLELAVLNGEKALKEAGLNMHVNLADIPEDKWETLLRDRQLKNKDDLLAAIGIGKELAQSVISALAMKSFETMQGSSHVITLRGDEAESVKMMPCCHPVPGDSTVGFQGRNLSLQVHRQECPVTGAQDSDPSHWMDIKWASEPSIAQFPVPLLVTTQDLTSTIAKVCTKVANAKSSILGMQFKDNKKEAELYLTVLVHSHAHLEAVMREIKDIDKVKSLKRLLKIETMV